MRDEYKIKYNYKFLTINDLKAHAFAPKPHRRIGKC